MIPQKLVPDPTYIKGEIDANPAWKLAFELSEVDNDHAPIGWFRYIHIAAWLLNEFELVPKPSKSDVRDTR